MLAWTTLLASLLLAEGPSAWIPAPVDDATAPDNPAAVERILFGNQFQNQGMDQWCDQIPFQLPIGQDFVQDLGGARLLTGGFFNGNRQFVRYPNGEVAINDQVELKLDFGYALGKVLSAGKAVGFYFGATIDGQSLVTRPLHTADSCSQLKRLFSPSDIKTVLPFSAKRLAAMDVGELWIIPMTFQIAFEPLDAAKELPVGPKTMPSAAYLTIGASKTTDPTITVYRVSKEKVRLKLHLDRVRGFNGSIGAAFGPIPATDVGTPGAEILLSRIMPDVLPTFVKLFSRQLDDILAIQASIGGSAATGQQVLLQYTLDATNLDEMERLAQVIKGDLSMLKALRQFASLKNPDASSPAMKADLDKLRQAHDLKLRAVPDIAGIDDYDTRTKSANVSVPIVIAYQHQSTRSHDHYVTELPDVHDIESNKVLSQSTLSFLHFPFVGALMNKNHTQGAQVLVDNSDAAGDKKGKPYLVYTNEWGILRESRSAIGDALQNADGLMATVGGNPDDNRALRLPREILDSTKDTHYHKGYLELSLVFGADAVQKIIAAPARQVVEAFARTLDGTAKTLFDAVLARTTVGDDGKIAFSREQLDGVDEYRYAREERDRTHLEMVARYLCGEASKLYKSLSRVRALAGEPVKQAEALFKLASGKGGVDEETFMKTALRLTSPGDVAGDLLLHLDKDKTSASNYTVRYVLNPMLFGDVVLKGMSVVERGFIAPTPSAPLND